MPQARKIWPNSYLTRTLLLRMRFSIKMQYKSVKPVILDTQEDHGLKPASANSSQHPISKKAFTKKYGW
jgi:hypothetical protein